MNPIESSELILNDKIKEYFNVVTISTLKQVSKEFNVPYLKLVHLWNKMNDEYRIGELKNFKQISCDKLE